jgi:DNA topoisomerase IB
VLSCAIRLIDLGLFRIGSEEYARENDSYGLATLRRDHVRVRGDEVRFSYPAKSGVEGSQRLRDPVVRDVVRALKRRRDDNPELMGWWSPSQRRWYDVRSAHVNEHLRELTGLDVTAKDFRTWHATVYFATTLARVPKGLRVTARRRAVSSAYRAVAEALGNTPAVAKKSYVHPRLVDLFEHGTTIDAAPDDEAASIEIVTDEASLAVARLLSPS